MEIEANVFAAELLIRKVFLKDDLAGPLDIGGEKIISAPQQCTTGFSAIFPIEDFCLVETYHDKRRPGASDMCRATDERRTRRTGSRILPADAGELHSIAARANATVLARRPQLLI